MDLTDATLMIMTESAAHPTIATLAGSAHDQLTAKGEVGYRVLRDMIDEASAKGVLRAIRQKYSATAFEAMIAPILREIDRQNPPPPRRTRPAGPDPLTAPDW